MDDAQLRAVVRDEIRAAFRVLERLAGEETASEPLLEALVDISRELAEDLSWGSDPVPLPGKLVRDGIPKIIRDSGKSPIFHKCDSAEFRQRLLIKLSEEIAELKAADDKAAVIEELADVLEVLRALAYEHIVSWTDVERTAKEKHRLAGGFSQHYVWLGNN